MKTDIRKPRRSTLYRRRVMAGVGLIAFAAAWGSGTAGAQPLPTDASLRLAGSNTVGQSLAAELLLAWARKNGMPNVRIEAGKAEEEYDVIGERAERTGRLRAQVRAHGTGTGTEPLARGQADIWMASRQARESDLEAVRRKGVADMPTLAQFHAPGNEHIIALDALAILAHPGNTVAALSVAQLRDIFLGRITRWSELGGPELPINVISRDTNSGTFDTFCTLVMGIGETAKCAEAMKPAKPRMFESSEDLSDTVASNPAAIGFVGAAYLRNAKAVPVALSCGISVLPDTFAIKADEYPLSRRLYLYGYPGRAPSAEASAFLAFVQTTDGQNAVRESGTVDLLATPAPADYAARRLETARNSLDGGHTRIRAADVQALELATSGATRLSITFRFQAGSDALDTRSEGDVRRLAEVLRSPSLARAQVLLIGFSQAQGDYTGNRALSRDRAEAVRQRLAAEPGIGSLTAIGVGPAAPVVCNDTVESARMNQRVEVWIRRPSGS